MPSAVQLLVLCAAAAVAAGLPQQAARADAARPATTWLCQRPECSCADDNGLEMVTCDCSSVADQQPLLLGDRSAFVSDRTKKLEVRDCDRVTVVPQALSRAISLTELRLNRIGELLLREHSMYTTDGRGREVHVGQVANLTAEPRAFDRVATLELLELDEVRAERLPLALFGPDTHVVTLRLTGSRLQQVELRLPKADRVAVLNSTVDALTMDVGDVLSVEIVNSSVREVDALRFNVRPNFHSNEENVVNITGNEIESVDLADIDVTVDTFTLVNNEIGSLSAPLRVNYVTADVSGNSFRRLGDRAFAALARLEPLDIRMRTRPAEPFALTFADNTILGPVNGSYGRFLSPDDESTPPLYSVRGNIFRCRCEELAGLVEEGDRAFLAAANDSRPADASQSPAGLATSDDVYRVLYETSTCLEDLLPLTQFRLKAYNADYACDAEPAGTDRSGDDAGSGGSGAGATAAGLLTVLLAATAAGGVVV